VADEPADNPHSGSRWEPPVTLGGIGGYAVGQAAGSDTVETGVVRDAVPDGDGFHGGPWDGDRLVPPGDDGSADDGSGGDRGTGGGTTDGATDEGDGTA
jgi:hypothetical protein